MSVCRTVSEIFSVKEWRELETGGRSRSRSLKMAPFNRSLYGFLLIGHCKYIYLFKHFTIHIEHGIKTAIANECELIARSGTCHLRPAKS